MTFVRHLAPENASLDHEDNNSCENGEDMFNDDRELRAI
jgi:hypothetical protein